MKTALFYPGALGEAQRQSLIAGVLEAAPFDRIDFPHEDGGEASQELAIPLLPGMDDVRVDEARLRLRVVSGGSP